MFAEDLIKLASTWGMSALGGLAIIVAGIVVARVVRRMFRLGFDRLRMDPTLAAVMSNLVYYFALAIFLIAGLGVMGIETASLITILGTCSLAIGLALQGSLANFAAGLMLFIFRPFRRQDYIETGEFAGHVAEAGLFSTAIDTLDNVRVVIPNSYISQRPLSNWHTNGHRRLSLDLEIGISSELAAARDAVARRLTEDPRVLDAPAPFVAIEDFGDTSARLLAQCWCRPADYWPLRLELPERIKAAIEAAGAALPTPRREVVLIQSA
jgi:small conductance mechanosensitive channel